jgi:hypothetical protein
MSRKKYVSVKLDEMSAYFMTDQVKELSQKHCRCCLGRFHFGDHVFFHLPSKSGPS